MIWIQTCLFAPFCTMTSLCELHLDISNMYLHTKEEHSGSRHLKFRAQTAYINTLFCSCDLNLDLLTLIYDLDTDVLKIYLHNKTF